MKLKSFVFLIIFIISFAIVTGGEGTSSEAGIRSIKDLNYLFFYTVILLIFFIGLFYFLPLGSTAKK